MADTKRIACLYLLSGPSRPFQASTPINEGRLHALAEACGRFSPQIAVRPGEAVFLEIGGSRALFSEESIRHRLVALASRMGFHGRVGIADDAPTALAFAREGLNDRGRLHLDAIQDYLSPFESLANTPELERATGRMVHLLQALGLRTLGDLLKLPQGSLASRFGREAVEIRARVEGRLEIPWPGFRPAEKVMEESQQGGENVEALVFLLKGLVDRVMARLRGRCERLVSSRVVLVPERGADRAIGIELALPQGSSSGVIPIIQERLSHAIEREPLIEPVERVRFEVLETAPGRGAQRDFFSKKEEEDELFESLFSRLSQKVGQENAFLASPLARHRPEGAYVRSLKFTELPPPEFTPERPMRLLGRPERIEIRGDLIFRRSGGPWRVIRWEGPERISGEWWKTGFDRDYFRVTTREGEALWIFRNRVRESGMAYLHGFFD